MKHSFLLLTCMILFSTSCEVQNLESEETQAGDGIVTSLAEAKNQTNTRDEVSLAPEQAQLVYDMMQTAEYEEYIMAYIELSSGKLVFPEFRSEEEAQMYQENFVELLTAALNEGDMQTFSGLLGYETLEEFNSLQEQVFEKFDLITNQFETFFSLNYELQTEIEITLLNTGMQYYTGQMTLCYDDGCKLEYEFCSDHAFYRYEGNISYCNYTQNSNPADYRYCIRSAARDFYNDMTTCIAFYKFCNIWCKITDGLPGSF